MLDHLLADHAGLAHLIGPHNGQAELRDGGLNNIFHQEIRVAAFLGVVLPNWGDVEANIREVSRYTNAVACCGSNRQRSYFTTASRLTVVSSGPGCCFLQYLFDRNNALRPGDGSEQTEKL